MHIILEGIDASGKSTLARHLADALGYEIQGSEGPEKEPGEILTRIMRYDRMMHRRSGIIFDRHPVFSHPIYSQGSKWMTRIPPAIINDLLTRPILIVYCRPMTEGFDNHVAAEGEDPEHLKKVSANYTQWLADYDAWAVRHAHMIYNCGQQFDETAQRILKVVR